MPNITSKSYAHMIAQVRVRQLATRDSQNKLQEKIIALWEEKNELSGQKCIKTLQNQLEEMYITSTCINNSLQKASLYQVGYPIKNNKTSLQIKMAQQWAQEKEDNLIGSIEMGKLYHDLSNGIDEELPRLQSPSETIFWGNENPSVSSLSLFAIAYSMDLQQNTMPGAALRYPFYDTSYTLRDIPLTYPFASEKNMWLFGDYQFGGQRYLGSQKSLLGPQDCSEAVANSTNVKETEQLSFSTVDIRDAFFKKDNAYGYLPVTSTYNGSLELELIQPGDIYVTKGHTAIITDINSKGEIGTIEFNRDIDRPTEKILGGGTYSYNLIEKAKTTGINSVSQIYILRDQHLPLKESCSYSDLIHKIDSTYLHRFGNQPKDETGDCSLFISENFWRNSSSNNYSPCVLC